jgi:hypothetical protein
MRSPAKGTSAVLMCAWVHSSATLPSSLILHGHHRKVLAPAALCLLSTQRSGCWLQP